MSKCGEQQPFPHGAVVITIDTERMWGYHDLFDESRFAQRFPDADPIHDRLLRHLADARLSATWAVVGGLALDGSQGAEDPRFRGLPPRWLRRIPKGDQKSAPLWYARDFVERLQAVQSRQEIGLHGGLTHLPWGAATTTADDARVELQRGLAALRELGVDARSFVFPRDLERYHEILQEAGLQCFRGRAPIWSERLGNGLPGSCARAIEELAELVPPVVWPTEFLPGLWNLPASMPLYTMARGRSRVIPLRLRRRRVQLGMDAATRRRGVFHLFLHPENLVEAREAMPTFESIVEAMVAWRDHAGGEVLTMGETISRVSGGVSGAVVNSTE